jgi:choline dehydrogenase-like flavoprotein
MIENASRQADRTPSKRADVCVVGAGVAGALVAYSLSKRDHDVVILEAGERFDFERRIEQMEQAIRPSSSFTDVWNMGGRRDQYTSSGEVPYSLNKTRVKGVGGTTLHWLGISPRLHEKDFEMRSRYGIASDWPISYDDLRPYYAEAEREMGVAGGNDNPFAPPRKKDFPMDAFPPSYSDTLYAEACERLGITIHSVPQARNSEPYDDRSPCLGYSTCLPVCPSGAKYTGDIHIDKAEREGARVISQASVQRLEHDSTGDHVTTAVYATPDGESHRQHADTFVVACGAVETARLLLLSQSEAYPDGLANSSGLVGRYFMEHPLVVVSGELDEPANQNPIGYHTSESHQFYDHGDEAPPGSIKLGFLNENPTSPVNTALRGGDEGTRGDITDVVTGDEWGDQLLETIQAQHTENRVAMFAIPEPLPRKESRISLDPSKTDDHGNPVPDVSWNLGSYERETGRRAIEIMREILDEMGAETTVERDMENNPGRASHHAGTTRMGTDPSKSVVNAESRTHDSGNLYIASGSVFVTAGALNPTSTIAALSLRVADHINNTT